MTIVACHATWCHYNADGFCSLDTIDLSPARMIDEAKGLTELHLRCSYYLHFSRALELEARKGERGDH